MSIELFGIKEGEGTYIHEAYESLPPIEIPEQNLDWLNLTEFEVGVNEEESYVLEKEERQKFKELWVNIQQQVDWLNIPEFEVGISDEEENYALEKEERQEFQERWLNIQQQARDLQLTFPDYFLELIESFYLQDSIPSGTGCYFDLPDRISESPFQTGDYILRFYNDSQCCICWYLYFRQSGEVEVIASSGTEYSPFLEDADASSIEFAKEYTYWVSPSFLEFLYRWWLENHIWFKLREQMTLSSQELAYIRYYQPSYPQ